MWLVGGWWVFGHACTLAFVEYICELPSLDCVSLPLGSSMVEAEGQ